MIAYYLLEAKGDAAIGDEEFVTRVNSDMGDANKATPIKIEKLVKLQKQHRCAFESDRGFVERHTIDLT